MAGTVFVSCLEPKTTQELVKFIYGVESAADVNSTPVIKARACLYHAHYLVPEGDLLRNTKFRASSKPIREYIESVITRDSSLTFDSEVFDALEKVLDSAWFRGFLSPDILLNPPRYVVYNNVHVNEKGKLIVSDAIGLVTMILADIGVFADAFHALSEPEGGFPSLELKDILSASRFDDCIQQHQNTLPTSLLKKFVDELCRYRTDERGLPSESGKTLVPEQMLDHMSWVPGMLPPDLCELMIRSSGRPPITLRTTLRCVVIPNITKGKNVPEITMQVADPSDLS